MLVRILGKREIAAGTMEFTFDTEGVFNYEAGQNWDLELDELLVPDDGKGRMRTFSLVRSPAVGTPTIATRMTGSAFKETLKAMPVGASLTATGPLGTFTLPRESKRPVVFHAGGIGITPQFSMIEDAALRNLPHKITLVYSNRAPSSTAFLKELQGFEKKNPRFKLLATMTDIGSEPWTGHTGIVDDLFLNKNVPDLAVSVHYISGPPGLVAATRSILISAGIEDVFIKTEEFTGY